MTLRDDLLMVCHPWKVFVDFLVKVCHQENPFTFKTFFYSQKAVGRVLLTDVL